MSRPAALLSEHSAAGSAAAGLPDAARRRRPGPGGSTQPAGGGAAARAAQVWPGAHAPGSQRRVCRFAGLAALVLADPLEVVLLLGLIVGVLAAAHRLAPPVRTCASPSTWPCFWPSLNPLFSQGGLDVLWQADCRYCTSASLSRVSRSAP